MTRVMSGWAAFREGMRRVNAAPGVLVALALVMLLVTLIMSPVTRPTPRAVPAVAGAGQAAGADHAGWIAAQAAHVGAMSTPSAIWFAAVLRHAAAGTPDRLRARPAALLTLAWLAVWALLGGGVLARYVRNGPARPRGFLRTCATHAGPLLRLATIAGLVWLVLAGTLLGALATPDGAAGAAITPAAWILFAALAAAAAVVFDYARVRIVVEGRRSAIGALTAAVRLIGRRAGAVAGLFGLTVSSLLLAAAACRTLSAGAERADMLRWLVLAVEQICIVTELYLSVLVYASAAALVQGTPTRAGGAADPIVVWPDSPEAEPLEGTEAACAR
jgi:hypothetical protein